MGNPVINTGGNSNSQFLLFSQAAIVVINLYGASEQASCGLAICSYWSVTTTIHVLYPQFLGYIIVPIGQEKALDNWSRTHSLFQYFQMWITISLFSESKIQVDYNAVCWILSVRCLKVRSSSSCFFLHQNHWPWINDKCEEKSRKRHGVENAKAFNQRWNDKGILKSMQMNTSLKDCWVVEYYKNQKEKKIKLEWDIGFLTEVRINFFGQRKIWEVSRAHSTTLSS